MKLSIIGLPGAGKTTLFEALTKTPIPPEQRIENKTGVVKVPDSRVDRLSLLYKPKKTNYARVNYFIPGVIPGADPKAREQRWADVRDSDAFIQVLRHFSVPGLDAPDPLSDLRKMEEEMIFSDLLVTEKRLERIEAEKKKNRTVDQEDRSLIEEVRSLLENNQPVRTRPDLAVHPLLRGYAFLSAKPMLLIFNNPDENESLPEIKDLPEKLEFLAVRGKLEHEISRMSEEDSVEFLKEYNILETACDRVIRKSYDMLGLISYFTVGEDEVRAWTIRKETPAVLAAGAIHSDIEKGFIRAETVSFDDLMTAGNYAQARKNGTVRLEGKTYIVQDGDIMNFRFNV